MRNSMVSVRLLLEHPRKLLDIASSAPRTSDAGAITELLALLAANPLVENRWDVIRKLLELPTAARPVNLTYLQRSHAEAVAQLATETTIPFNDLRDRRHAMHRIAEMRFEDAPFASAADVIAALPHGNARDFAASYIRAMPTHLHRLSLTWERDALAARNSSPEAQLAAAVKELLALEEHLAAHHPAVLEDRHVRDLLLAAFGAARDAEHAQRHWRWLLDRRPPGRPVVRAKDRLAATRDRAELEAVVAEARAAFPAIAKGRRVVAREWKHVLVLHAARLGIVDDVVGRRQWNFLSVWWAARARAAEDGQAVHPPDAGGKLKAPEAFTLLRKAGMDWDGIVFMLGPFSPYSGQLRVFNERMAAAASAL